MITLKYPRGWSFAQTDSAFSKKNPVKYRLDRDIYIQAGAYWEAGVNGGINRFIDGMRKGFSVQDILEGKYDGIVDTDPRNLVVPDTPLPELELTNKDIENTPENGYVSLEDMAKGLNKSIATIKRFRADWRIAKIGDRYYVNESDTPEE